VWLTPDQIERRLDQGGFDFAPGEPYTGKRAKLEKLRRPQRLEAAMKIDPGLARSGDLWGMLDWGK
jgi:hypothetical protein